MRQAIFRREAFLQHALPDLDRTGEQLAELNAVSLDLMTDEERELMHRNEITKGVFSRLTQIQGGMVDRYFGAMDATQWLSQDHRVTVEQEAALLSGALPRSGYARAAVGFGASSASAGLRAPTLILRSSVFSEEIGDQRLHGLQPSAGIETLGGDLVLQPSSGPEMPRVVSSDVTFASFATLLLDLPSERRNWLGQLGWGGRMDWDYRSDEALPYHGEVHAEVLQAPYTNNQYQNFTALGLGAIGQARWSFMNAALVAGPRVSLIHRTHLGGSSGNALRLEASYFPALEIHPGAVWIHEARATASVSWLMCEVGHWDFLLRPEASASWRREPGIAPGADASSGYPLFGIAIAALVGPEPSRGR